MAAHENLITQADINIRAREIDFVTSFARNWQALQEILGITRAIRMMPGTMLKSKYATGELQSGKVEEGDMIPRSKFTVAEKNYEEIDIEKFAKETSIEAVKKHGYDVAVGMTDEEFQVELQDMVMDRFYEYLNTGTMTFEEKTFQMAFAMALGKVKNKFKAMHKNATGTAVFANTLDVYAYLGSSEVTVQTAFGMTYIENFLGADVVFMLSEEQISRGKLIATPINNIVAYYVDPADSDFVKMGLEYRTDGETNLIGFHAKGDYDRATSVAYAIMGFTLFAEYIDAIAVVTINPNATATESDNTAGTQSLSGDAAGE